MTEFAAPVVAHVVVRSIANVAVVSTTTADAFGTVTIWGEPPPIAPARKMAPWTVTVPLTPAVRHVTTHSPSHAQLTADVL